MLFLKFLLVCCDLVSDLLQLGQQLMIILVDLGNILRIIQKSLKISRREKHLDIGLISGFIHCLDTSLKSVVLNRFILFRLLEILLCHCDLAFRLHNLFGDILQLFHVLLNL